MRLLTVVIFLFVFSTTAFSQKTNLLDRRTVLAQPQRSDVHTVLQSVEKGIARGFVSEFSRFFSSQVRLSFSEQEGYYSANQTTSVLQNYFHAVKPEAFAFSSYEDKGNNPFATGRFTYVQKGNRESAQIYVSLTREDSKWVITQFNIY